MDKKELREDAKTYFVPIILGSNRQSHALSSKIFRKYKIRAVISDTRKSLWHLFDPFSTFLPLASSNSMLCLEQLTSFALSEDYTLPILIPCSDEFNMFAEKLKGELEKVFVICSSKDVLSSSPMSVMD